MVTSSNGDIFRVTDPLCGGMWWVCLKWHSLRVAFCFLFFLFLLIFVSVVALHFFTEQFIPWNSVYGFVVLSFVVAILSPYGPMSLWIIYPYMAGLLHWQCEIIWLPHNLQDPGTKSTPFDTKISHRNVDCIQTFHGVQYIIHGVGYHVPRVGSLVI